MLVTAVINCKLLNCVECGQTKHDQFVVYVAILTISALCVVIRTRVGFLLVMLMLMFLLQFYSSVLCCEFKFSMKLIIHL